MRDKRQGNLNDLRQILERFMSQNFRRERLLGMPIPGIYFRCSNFLVCVQLKTFAFGTGGNHL